jgi:hypothetical protein
MVSETSNKTATAGRYGGVFVSGALTIFMALGSFDPDQQKQILSSIHAMYAAIHDFVGAAANIWYIIFPVIAVWLGKLGINSSGFGSMMDRIFQAAKAGDIEAQRTIINAAASPELGTHEIINPTLASDPKTPANVVASPQTKG